MGGLNCPFFTKKLRRWHGIPLLAHHLKNRDSVWLVDWRAQSPRLSPLFLYLLFWNLLRDDEVKPCVSISSSNEIMIFLIVRFSIGARSTDLSPESFLSASIGARSTDLSPESFLSG